MARNSSARFTFESGLENAPVWSPDGRRIAYAHDQNGPPNLFVKGISDPEGESLIPSQDGPQSPTDWSPDGQFIIYGDLFSKTKVDLYILPMSGERKPLPFARTPFMEGQGRFSPDGRWIAYTSTESGKTEVYVQRFQGNGERVQVSTAGGTSPRWRGDGRELFFLSSAPNRQVMSVQVTTGETFTAGTPAPLFKVELRSSLDFEVARDGQRFIINTNAGVPATPLTVVTGWARNLKRDAVCNEREVKVSSHGPSWCMEALACLPQRVVLRSWAIPLVRLMAVQQIQGPARTKGVAREYERDLCGGA